MKKFSLHAQLLEDRSQHYLSIDHRDRNEYYFKNRKGILTRRCGEGWQSSSIELGSLDEAPQYLDKNIVPKAPWPGPGRGPFSPGKLLRENEYVLSALAGLDLAEWRLIIRYNRTGRLVLRDGGKKRETIFDYFSLLVKFRLQGQEDFIEVGEGSTSEPRFNRDGLVTRIREIVQNRLQSKDFEFTRAVPVILNSGDGAILFHEILGHSLEADHVYHGLSPISRADLGQRIISPNVTLVGDDKKDTFFKSLAWDDEGEPCKPLVLVKNGVLKNLIADSYHKHLLDLKSAGFSRLQDFTTLPMPRMYALYLKPGTYHRQELIESTDYGVFAKEFGQGKVHFDKNVFYFNIKEAFLIEKGKITRPLGGVVVGGDIVGTLNSVTMVADDFRYDKGIGYCYKNGQTVNVRVGQPTVKIEDLWVTRGSDA